MILSPISLLDCFVFILLLAPQLLIHVGVYETLLVALRALPHIVFEVPYHITRARYLLPPSKRPQYSAEAPFFAALVIRVVRYAFANIPSSVGCVFLSRSVALPWIRFRFFRHGYLIARNTPVSYQEIDTSLLRRDGRDFTGPKSSEDHDSPMTEKPVKGVWLIADPDRKPTTVVYYLHGGGFCMGSPYFYLEFLMVWVHLLEQQATSASNFVNPALFALDYTLVPTGTYPKQLLQVLDGYRYILDYCKVDPSRVCFAGDSAGATLAVSALLAIAGAGARSAEIEQAASGLGRPAYATLLSPWCSLAGKMNANSPSDYLDADVLKEYGLLYAGKRRITHQQLRTSPPKEEGDHWGSIASPGDITSKALWQRATPTHGWHFIFGGEETLAPGMRELASRIEDALGDTRHTEPKSDDDTLAVNIPSNKAARGRHVTVDEETGQVHAWPVVDLFLTTATDDRLKGLRRIVKVMTENMQP